MSYYVFNPQYYKPADDFFLTRDGKYTSNDARLFDIPRDIRMDLDIPPYENTDPVTGGARDSRIGFVPYHKRNGAIMYYVDSEMLDPFVVLSKRPSGNGAAETGERSVYSQVFTDPMGKTYVDVIPNSDVSESGEGTFNREADDRALFNSQRQGLLMRSMNKNRFETQHYYYPSRF